MSDDEEFLQFLDTQPLAFGKYKGHTPEEVVEFDPSYIQWLYNEVKPRVCSRALAVSVEQSNEERDSQDGPKFR